MTENGHPQIGNKKGKATPTALEDALPVIFSHHYRGGYLLQR